MVPSVIYGTVAFLIGFVFGALRQFVLIPAFGETAGHWIEFPFVTGCICLLGWWIARKWTAPALLIGVLGTLILLAIEMVFAIGIMGMPVSAYFAQFDILAGALFPWGLFLMALAPLLSRMAARR